MGANLLQVSRWLGHSSVLITADVYGHLFSETNDVVMSRLDDTFNALDATPGAEEGDAGTIGALP
jgi:integrase